MSQEAIINQAITAAIALIVGVLGTALVGFIKRATEDRKKIEADGLRKEFRDMVNELREEVGKFKMINEAQWKHIEELKSDVRDLRKELV